MTETAAIAWAVLATGLGLTAAVGWIIADNKLRFALRQTWVYRDAVVALQTRLHAIHQSRHNAAVKARAAQIAQRKAQVLAKAAELQVDRIAA